MDNYCLFTPVRLSTGKPAPITKALQINGYWGKGYVDESFPAMISTGKRCFLDDVAHEQCFMVVVEKLPGFIEGFTKPHTFWGNTENPFFDCLSSATEHEDFVGTEIFRKI